MIARCVEGLCTRLSTVTPDQMERGRSRDQQSSAMQEWRQRKGQKREKGIEDQQRIHRQAHEDVASRPARERGYLGTHPIAGRITKTGWGGEEIEETGGDGCGKGRRVGRGERTRSASR